MTRNKKLTAVKHVDPLESRTTRRQEARVARSVMGKIEELSQERERLLAREGTHRADAADRERLWQIDHDLQVLWDLKRRELAGETIDLDDDFFDRFTIDPGTDAPGR
jgi:Protein of unknown function (DUF2630)